MNKELKRVFVNIYGALYISLHVLMGAFVLPLCFYGAFFSDIFPVFKLIMGSLGIFVLLGTAIAVIDGYEGKRRWILKKYGNDVRHQIKLRHMREIREKEKNSFESDFDYDVARAREMRYRDRGF